MRCPTCHRPSEAKDNPYRPFCSERCKLVDLGNWLSERYRIPGAKVDESDPSHEGEEDDGGE